MTITNTEELKKEIKEEFIKNEILMELEDNQALSLTDIITTLKNNRNFIFLFTSIITLLTIIIVLSMPNYYKSSASIYVFFNGKSSALKGFLKNFNMESGADSSNVKLLTSSLKSESMKEYIINKFGVATNPAFIGNKPLIDDEAAKDKILRKFDKYVNVNYDQINNLITISAETMSATTSASIVNAYLEKLDYFSYGPQKAKLLFIDDQLKKIKSELEKAENELKDFQEKNAFFSVDKQVNQIINNLASLESNKDEIDISISLLESYSNSQAFDEIDSNQLKVQKEAEKAQSSAIDLKIKQAEKELSSIPSISIEFARLKRNLIVKEKIYSILNEQREIAKIEDAEEGYQYKIIDRPRVSRLKSKPKRGIICLLSFLSSFVLSICIVILNNLSKKTSE